jgi:hypothetical protein
VRLDQQVLVQVDQVVPLEIVQVAIAVVLVDRVQVDQGVPVVLVARVAQVVPLVIVQVATVQVLIVQVVIVRVEAEAVVVLAEIAEALAEAAAHLIVRDEKVAIERVTDDNLSYLIKSKNLVLQRTRFFYV